MKISKKKTKIELDEEKNESSSEKGWKVWNHQYCEKNALVLQRINAHVAFEWEVMKIRGRVKVGWEFPKMASGYGFECDII